MFEPWITLPVKDVRIHLPMSMFDEEIRIMFRDVETIDKTIEQLQSLKERMPDMRIYMNDQ